MPDFTAYPLQWPVQIPRTAAHERSHSRFERLDWGTLLREIQREVTLIGGTGMVVSTNQPIRRDGSPYAAPRRIDDPGAALYFELDGEAMVFPCDRWETLAENLRAIALHLDAMRGMRRWGVGTARQQYTGYKALTSGTPIEPWWKVLSVRPDASIDEIEAAYRSAAKLAHPDHGGLPGAMETINIARDQARAEKGAAR